MKRPSRSKSIPIRASVTAVLIALGALTGPAFCAEPPPGVAVIVVDMIKGTITPPYPVVNLSAGESVVVRIEPRSDDWRSRVVGTGGGHEAVGSDVIINFRSVATTQTEEVVALPDQSRAGGHYNSFYVRGDIRTIGLRIKLENWDELLAGKPKDVPPVTADAVRQQWAKETGISADDVLLILRNTPFTVPIRADRKPFALQFGAGFAFMGQRDERYGLRARTGDTGNSDVVRLENGDWSTRIAAFAHYTPVSRKTLVCCAISFGLGTDLPSSGLTAMLGGSVRLATLPIVDSMYLTGGVAYLPRQRLLATYETTPIASSTVDTKDLVGTRYGFGAFVGITFGFFGGASEFKAVYAGKKPSGAND